METPVKKKRSRAPKIDKAASATSSSAPASAETGSSSAPALNADLSSRPYQYVTDIDMSNQQVTANDGLDDLFEDIEKGPDPTSVFHESHEEKMITQLLEYNARGPSPTQCNDEDWNRMMDIPAKNQPTDGRSYVDPTSQALEASPPALTTGTTNTTDNHVTDLFDAAAASPATPHPTSHTVEALETSSAPPSLKVPNTSQLSEFHSAGLASEGQPENLNFSDSNSNASSVNGFAEPQEIQQATPARQPLGSPFAAARQATANMVKMLDASSPPGVRQCSMNNTSMSSPLPRSQTHFTGGSMPNMVNPRYQAAPVIFRSAPTPAMFMNNPQMNNVLQSDPAMSQHAAAKRMRVAPMGSQDFFGNMTPEQQMHRQRQIHLQNQLNSSTVDPRLLSNSGPSNVQNWISSQIHNTPPPPEMTPRSGGYDFPIPTPSGSLGGVQQRTDHDMNMAQKRSASQMSQGDVGKNNVEDPFGSPGVAQSGDGLQGISIPQNPTQFAMLMASRQRTIRQLRLQSAMLAQARNQMLMNQTSSPNQAQTPSQGQLQAQQRVQMTMHGQGHSSQVSPSPQMRNFQQQRQSQQGTPQQSINTPTQMVGSSPSGANAGPQASPTPAPRRRGTVSKPAQNIGASSPLTAPRGKKVQNTPTKKRTSSQKTSASAQNRTPTGSGQISDMQTMETPEYMRGQLDGTQQTMAGTPSDETPLPLRSHLPTPQQPISTGPCPNTINETLAETNARTAAELGNLGAEVRDYVPNWYPASTHENQYGFDQLGETVQAGIGPPFANANFNSPMDFTIPSGMGFNTNMRTHANMMANGNMNGLNNLYTQVSTNMDMTTISNMYPASSPAIEHGTTIPTPATLQNSVLNSGSGARESSVGFAETVMSGTPTPIINHLAHPGSNSSASASNVVSDSALDPSDHLMFSASGADGHLRNATDGSADLEGQPFETMEQLDRWANDFDETTPFNLDDWAVSGL